MSVCVCVWASVCDDYFPCNHNESEAERDVEGLCVLKISMCGACCARFFESDSKTLHSAGPFIIISNGISSCLLFVAGAAAELRVCLCFKIADCSVLCCL